MRIATLAAVAAVLALTTGCGSIHEYRSAEQLQPNEAIVVGRVRATLFGHAVTSWNSNVAPFATYRLDFKEKQTLKDEEWELPQDGLFACRVPAGTYGVYSMLTCRDSSIALASNLVLELFTFFYKSYTVSGNDWNAHQRWSWGPTTVGPALDGTVFEMTLEAGKTYWIGDRDISIDGEAFKQGVRSFTLTTSRKSFWMSENDFKSALSAKYPWVDVAHMIQAPNEDSPPPPRVAPAGAGSPQPPKKDNVAPPSSDPSPAPSTASPASAPAAPDPKASSAFCIKCGRKFPDGAQFCGGCGQPR
jgi:hypothetical protein